jgi:hypothetical protein
MHLGSRLLFLASRFIIIFCLPIAPLEVISITDTWAPLP